MAKQLFINCGGTKMPIVGFGTWQATNDELDAALDAALSDGYRHIDTATVYQNEEAIGKVLHRWLSAGKVTREELFITTKLPMFANKPELVEKMLKESLEKLQLEYVDLYLIHYPVLMKITEGSGVGMEPDGIADHAGIWKKMEEQVKAGRTKTIGLSNFSVRQIEAILDICKIRPANHQIEIHLHMQQDSMVDYCKSNGIGVTAYSSLGSRGSTDLPNGFKLNLPDLLSNEIAIKLAQKYSKTPAQILLRQIIQRGVAVIPKSTNKVRGKENLSIFDFSLTNDDMAELEAQNIGNSARIFSLDVVKGLQEHPQYPYPKRT